MYKNSEPMYKKETYKKTDIATLLQREVHVSSRLQYCPDVLETESQLYTSYVSEALPIEESHKLEGKVIIITDGDSNIGRSMAYTFAREGADIVISYLNSQFDVEEIKRHIELLGQQCLLISGNLKNKDDIHHVAKQVLKTFGRIDMLFNNHTVHHLAINTLYITEEQLDTMYALWSKEEIQPLNPGYSPDDYRIEGNQNWMTNIRDETLFTQLSIPGTHNSMATSRNRWVQTQSMSLQNQLHNGIRYLDIRLRAIDGVFAIHHGSYFLGTMFGAGVLEVVTSFLLRNPGETIIMRLRQEHDPVPWSEFNRILAWYMDIYGRGFFYSGGINPNLREVRGKIVVLRDYMANSSTNVGISWWDFNIQDDYWIGTIGQQPRKWDAIRRQLHVANDGNSFRRVINHVSGTGIRAPHVFARSLNLWTYEYLRDNSLRYVGIVIADYPGPGLINQILRCNAVAGNNYLVDGGATVGPDTDLNNTKVSSTKESVIHELQ